MDHRSEWLEKLLSEERDDILTLLDSKHKMLIASFKEQVAREVVEHLPAVSQHREEDTEKCTIVQSHIVPPPLSMSLPQPSLIVNTSNEHIRSKHTSSSEGPSVWSKNSNTSDTRLLLTQFFDLVDSDESGVITLDEVRAALQKVGQSPAQARRLVADMGRLCKVTGGAMNGQIHKEDWMLVVESQSPSNMLEICQFAERLQIRAVKDSKRNSKLSDCCIMSVDSHRRLLWNALCAICVVYIAVFVPYWIAFDRDDISMVLPKQPRDVIGKLIDVIFLLDIVISFRTSYRENGQEVRHWRRVALHYARTWFPIDAISSIPVGFVENADMGATPIKLLKFVRLFTMLKVMRSAKAVHVLSQSEFGEHLEDFVIERRLHGKVKLLFIMFSLFLCSHWLACAMAACGMHFLDLLSPGWLEPGSYYLPSFYWAMTTIATVGYGDIVPRTDNERVVAMLAMCIGGTFYALNISVLTSIILVHDRAKAERARRMEIVNHWLRRHPFPNALKRRLRRYFKGYLSHKENSTREELDVFEELTSDLRLDVARVLVPEEVRVVPIFAHVPDFVTGFLLSILQMVSFGAHEPVVKAGHYGVTMFVIIRGHCVKSTPADPRCVISIEDSTHLFVGESFGEEIILSLAEEYGYHVIAQENSDLYTIAKSLFLRAMAAFPHHLDSMRDFFQSSMRSEMPFTNALDEPRADPNWDVYST